MDNLKTKVLKSKSSNTTISKENRRQGKKSRSNADIPPFSFKKRGVYVEKKPTKTSMTNELVKLPKRPKVIPRPAKKKFLDSILTILSKSTTGTQYPELVNGSNKKMRNLKVYERNVVGDLNTAKKQSKYRSKILNEHKDLDVDNVVVLRSKKEIVQTPSNYSEKSKDKVSIKWSDFIPPIAHKMNSVTKTAKINVKYEDGIAVNEIKSGQTVINNVKPKKRKIEQRVKIMSNTDEPMTLVANESQQDDNKLYDFFVDLLETTLSAYEVNVQPEISNPASKLNIETTDSVINKINLENIINYNHTPTDYKSKHNFHMNDDWDETYLDGVRSMSLRDISPERPLVQTRERRKLKPDTYPLRKKIHVPAPGTRSFVYQNFSTPPKKMLKKDRKKNLLNLLKEQLRIEDGSYEQPQNFFESLQMMAKYKKKCQKSHTIHFDDSAKKGSEGSVYDCMYKRRRVLSTITRNSYRSTKSNDKSFRSFSYKSALSSERKPRIDSSLDNGAESRMSLAVYSYDIDQRSLSDVKPTNKGVQDVIISSAISSDSTILNSLTNQESFGQW